MNTFEPPSGVAISIRQPWAWMILNAGKDVENRLWPTHYRGHIYIHASKGMTHLEYQEAQLFAAKLKVQLPPEKELPRGGIVGEAELVDCVTEHSSPWYAGWFGFVLKNAKPLPFYACQGKLGIFKV